MKPTNNQPSVFKQYRFYLKVAYAVLTIILLVIGIRVWDAYRAMNGWKEHKQYQPQMATQAPDTLYDTEYEIKQAKKTFEWQYNQLFDVEKQDITTKLSENTLNELKTALDNIKQGSEPYREKYEQLLRYFTIQQDYQNLFSDYGKGVLKPEVTPEVIQQLNAKHFNQIYDIMVKTGNQNQFAKRIYELQELLIADSNLINGMIEHVNDTLIAPPSNQLRVNFDALNTDLTENDKRYNQLNFTWNNLVKLDSITNQIRPLLTQAKNQNGDYLNYLEDAKARDTAFSEWHSERQSMLDSMTSEQKSQELALDSEYTNTDETITRNEQDDDNNTLIELNNLVGFSKEEITQWAKKNNLAVEFEYGHKDGAKTGYAIETKPKAGSTIPINTVIHVVIQK